MARVEEGLADERDAAHERGGIRAKRVAAWKRDVQRHGGPHDHRAVRVDREPAHLRIDLGRDDVDERAVPRNRVAARHDQRVGEPRVGKLAQIRRAGVQEIGRLHVRAQQLAAAEPLGDFAAVGILRCRGGRLVDAREACRSIRPGYTVRPAPSTRWTSPGIGVAALN